MDQRATGQQRAYRLTSLVRQNRFVGHCVRTEGLPVTIVASICQSPDLYAAMCARFDDIHYLCLKHTEGCCLCRPSITFRCTCFVPCFAYAFVCPLGAVVHRECPLERPTVVANNCDDNESGTSAKVRVQLATNEAKIAKRFRG